MALARGTGKHAAARVERRLKVLFVDDDPDVLEGLERIFRRERAHWELRFARNGTAALEELRRETADVLVTDLRMPVMDGAALLAAVRLEFPKTMRIVLSGETDSSLFERAWPASHMMVAKPCEHRCLRDAIARVVELAAA
jgi:YesN/AraC family two-component response regulator